MTRTIALAQAEGKRAEFWFKYGVDDYVREQIEQLGGVVRIGLGD